MSKSDSYAEGSASRESAYRAAFQSAAYRQWVAGLTPEQREEAQKKGLLEPKVDHDTQGEVTPSEERRRVPEATSDFILPPEEGEAPEEELSLSALVREGGADSIHRRALQDFLCSHGNPELTWACLQYLAGYGTCEAHAKALGLSRQAFNYHVRTIQKELGLPPMGNQRSESARRKYSRTNRRRLSAF